MSRPQHLLAALNISRLGKTVRQVLASKPGKEKIQVHGWVKSVRLQKRIAFAMIHDGTTSKSLQAVFQDPEYAKMSVRPLSSRKFLFSFLKRLTNGTSVRLTGVLASSPGSGQESELLAESVEVLGACDPEVLIISFKSSVPLTPLLLDLSHTKTSTHYRISSRPRPLASSH
jgi:asparaginyl-tRNA synthetase